MFRNYFVHVLAWIVFAYFFFSFTALAGSEYRAWSSKLETLREHRQLRAEFYFQKYLARAPHQLGISEEAVGAERRELETVCGAMTAAHNLAIQMEWRQYVCMYRLRMALDGAMPIFLSAANCAFSLLKGRLL